MAAFAHWGGESINLLTDEGCYNSGICGHINRQCENTCLGDNSTNTACVNTCPPSSNDINQGCANTCHITDQSCTHNDGDCKPTPTPASEVQAAGISMFSIGASALF